MTEEYVEEDKIKFLWTEYSNWISNTVISKYFDEDLKITRNIFINKITLQNYLSKVIIILEDKFTKYCAWEETD